ncbi:MAG: Rid family hydrolase [Candidatus Sulfotelmatobacter sp.]
MASRAALKSSSQALRSAALFPTERRRLFFYDGAAASADDAHNLEEADMDFCQVVSTNVYLDDLTDTPAFDEVYAKYFRDTSPARTTIQQIAPTERNPDKDGHYPDLEQVSLIAVRGECHGQ